MFSLDQRNRPVGYALIRSSLRTDSIIRSAGMFDYAAHIFDENTLGIRCARSYRTLGTFSRSDDFPGNVKTAPWRSYILAPLQGAPQNNNYNPG